MYIRNQITSFKRMDLMSRGGEIQKLEFFSNATLKMYSDGVWHRIPIWYYNGNTWILRPLYVYKM